MFSPKDTVLFYIPMDFAVSKFTSLGDELANAFIGYCQCADEYGIVNVKELSEKTCDTSHQIEKCTKELVEKGLLTFSPESQEVAVIDFRTWQKQASEDKKNGAETKYIEFCLSSSDNKTVYSYLSLSK